MFSESSRYYKQKTVIATTKSGRQVVGVVLRRLPRIEGIPHLVKGNDRLDIMAHRQFNDATRYWHIADANTELDAKELVEELSREIKIPEH